MSSQCPVVKFEVYVQYKPLSPALFPSTLLTLVSDMRWARRQGWTTAQHFSNHLLGFAELFKMAEVQNRPTGAVRGRGRGRRALDEGRKKLADGNQVKSF